MYSLLNTSVVVGNKAPGLRYTRRYSPLYGLGMGVRDILNQGNCQVNYFYKIVVKAIVKAIVKSIVRPKIFFKAIVK